MENLLWAMFVWNIWKLVLNILVSGGAITITEKGQSTPLSRGLISIVLIAVFGWALFRGWAS